MPRLLLIALHAVAGVYAGACVAIAAIDLRFLRELAEPALALASARVLLERMGKLMLPQLLVLLLLGALLSIDAVRRGRSLRGQVPSALIGVIWLVTLLAHFPINATILASDASPADLAGLLARWEAWHWVRTALALGLPAAVVWSVRPLPRKRPLPRGPAAAAPSVP